MGFLYKNSKLLKTILDSLEDQEGGAMYISCDVSNGGPVEPETGYVPNNPLFGLALDSPQQECTAASCIGCLSCQGNTTSLPISSLASNDFDCGSCFDTSGGGVGGGGSGGGGISCAGVSIVSGEVLGSAQSQSQANLINNSNSSNSYWSTDEMASTFPGLPPLDIDPLPSLFPFSPCGASYNFATNPHQASLSYTVHPHQMLISPNQHNHQSTQNQQNLLPHGNSLGSVTQTCYYDPVSGASGVNNAASMGCNQHMNAGNGGPLPPPAMYPSMSVNVSMNMTMHGYGAEATVPMQCSQMQWTPPNSSSSVNMLYPPLLSPSHYPAAATYSFTADFRPPTLQNAATTTTNIQPQIVIDQDEKQTPSPTNRTPFYAGPQIVIEQNYSPPEKSPTFSQTGDNKSFDSVGGYDDEDSNDDGSESKPNLCRLCGKTYARPSTLKTHLRTHSGERPYRCPDCNKSFSQAANLTAHVRTHTGQKPFRCPICDRRFSQSSSVTTHMRTHSGERPYRCSSCKKSFSDSSTLTKHLRIHSGEKPYQCKLCLLRFSQSGNLNRHMRVHGTNNNGNHSLIT